jgi:hypothetical protein
MTVVGIMYGKHRTPRAPLLHGREAQREMLHIGQLHAWGATVCCNMQVATC